MFLMAHFVRAAGAQNGISGLWSESATYLATVTRNGAATQVHGADLTAAELATLDWSSALVRVAGQNAKAVANGTATPVAIPDNHVGGYVTLSDRPNDNSFAMFGATAGTNLRMIEGVWTISTGLQVLDFASSDALVQYVPRFVPEYDPNFFHGTGQNACISCHGGGLTSLNHGYSTVGDLWDFDATNGLVYFDVPINWSQFATGAVILGAVGLDSVVRRRRGGSGRRWRSRVGHAGHGSGARGPP